MITAVDTNVLIDVFGADQEFGPRSKHAIARCLDEGSLVACDIVWAEVAACFASDAGAADMLGRLHVEYSPLEQSAVLEAGRQWRAYRQRGGARTRVVADFLIGAHALRQADRLLTRDRGFYARHFGGLVVLDPARGRG